MSVVVSVMRKGAISLLGNILKDSLDKIVESETGVLKVASSRSLPFFVNHPNPKPREHKTQTSNLNPYQNDALTHCLLPIAHCSLLIAHCSKVAAPMPKIAKGDPRWKRERWEYYSDGEEEELELVDATDKMSLDSKMFQTAGF